ncbi:MAG: hypothetical protein ACFFFC_20735, partial [Candidatus Thorarchaeota archaeon]
IPNDIRLVNPYPESLYERILWTVVGTFTDYMMRKMFRDGLVSTEAEVIRETRLICEHAVQISSIMQKTLETNEIIEEVAKHGRTWIDAYVKKSFESCIEETFMISQLDAVYRAGRFFALHRLGQDETEGFKPYLKRILKWLREEFSNASTVALNPTYGHPDICAADADIIINNTLYEIKTTRYPEKSVSKDMNQLLGYIALAYYHERHPIEGGPPIFDFKEAGFLFPLSLLHLETSISVFLDSHRQYFVDRILEIRKEHETKLAAVEKQPSSVGDMEFSEKVRNLLDKGKL